MPRKTDLTPQIQSRIVEALELGHFASEACKLVGITEKTYYEWKKRGEAGEEPFSEFLKSVEEAEAKAIDNALENIRAAGKEDWKAESWFLERRSKNWLKTEKVEVYGDEEKPVVIKLKWFDDLGKEKKENV